MVLLFKLAHSLTSFGKKKMPKEPKGDDERLSLGSESVTP
jgi:hypothetical protein